MKFETMLEATREWVKEFNAYPLSMIEKLFAAEPDDWREITPISEGCRVWSNGYQECGRITEIIEDEEGNEVVKVELDNGEEVETQREDLSREDDTYFPMWGTMWQFGDSCDDYWLENDNGLNEMAKCGFRIYESEEFGYFFGIDGAGYNFYDEHWLPLYKARGLQWHNEEVV